MRFICTEFDSNTNNLYRKEPIDQSVIPDNNQLLTKSHKIDTKDGVTYAYIADTLREVLFSQFIYDGTARTPSAWLTAKGLPGTDHTSLTGTFDFQNASVADIKCSYFFTIIAEDGLRFALPRRISTSKEIKSFNVISELKNYEDNFSFQGETGKIYTIGESPGDTVKAITIDSTLKSHRINKYKALQNVLTIQSGSDATPLDYVLHKGNYYLTISRSEIKPDLFIYTCVLENNGTNAISGSTITNYDNMILDSYSTTEVATKKTWIDGRRIYRKVINFGALPNTTQKDVAHGITFGANTRIININGYAWDGTVIQTVPTLEIVASRLIYAIATSINVSLGTAFNWSMYTECYIVLEYVY